MKETAFPWSGHSEDREIVHDSIAKIYTEKLKLPVPRFNWAPSPYSMFGAMQYLRKMQTDQRQEVIKGLVKGGDPLEATARAVFLESIIDHSVTVSMGACLRDQLLLKTGEGLLPVRDMAKIMAAQFTIHLHGGIASRAPGWVDWVLLPRRLRLQSRLAATGACYSPLREVRVD